MSNWKPREQKIQEGTYRSDRDIGPTVVNPTLTKPPTVFKSYLLNTVGKKQFKKICKILIEQNRLTTADIPLLENLARAYQDYFDAIEKIEDKGVVLEGTNKSGNSYYQKNPAFTVRKEMEDVILKYCAQLGITPYTRSRLNIQPAQEEDEIEKYLKG